MIRSHLISLTIILAVVVSPNTAAAQTDADSLAAQVDEVIAGLEQPDQPGCQCAVMHRGELVYSRAFGMANLEHDVPLTPESVIEVGSIGKQFTAASIALLALRGQLSLDDDIRTYVPELPDYGDTVTIRHLVHHTSGIPSENSLRVLTGWAGRDYNTNARTIARVTRHATLNFRSGDAYDYSGTGYALLAETVKRVSGTSLPEFAEKNIFGPLGMTNTRFNDDYTTVIRNRAQNYSPQRGGGWRRLTRHIDKVGASGLFTTAEDLVRWSRNYDHMAVGGLDFVELLVTPGTLNDGATLDYAFGLRLRQYRGLPIVRLSGGGRVLHFPGQRFSVAVLCNSQTINPNRLTRPVADIYLHDAFAAASTDNESLPALKAVSVPTSELEEVTGNYLRTVMGHAWTWSVEDDYIARRIHVDDDTLRYSVAGRERKLAPLGKGRFYVLAGTEVIVSFTLPTPEQPRQMTVAISGGKPSVFERVEPVSQFPVDLEPYVGTYYSEDLDYEQVFRITNGQLSRWDPNNWNEYGPLRPFGKDVFHAGWWMFFTFSRDEQGRVDGFTVETPSLRNLKFVRRDEP